MKMLLLSLVVAAFAAPLPAQESLPFADSLIARDVVPFLVLPDSAAEKISIRPEFVWTQVPGESLYVLQVGPDSLMEAGVMTDTVRHDTSAVWPGSLLNTAPYYWRVGVPGIDSGFAFSGVRKFTTCEPPHADAMTFPALRLKESGVAVTYLHNRAPFPVTVDSAWSSGGKVEMLTTLPVTIPGGDSVLLQCRHTARVLGDAVDNIVVRTDEGMAGFRVLAPCPIPVLLASSPQILFGTMAVTDSTRGGVILVNDGSLNTLTVRRVRTRTPFFHLLSEQAVKLEAGDSARVALMFQIGGLGRDAFGNYVDTLLIESDGGLGRVVLRGDSPPPRIGWEPPLLSFGDVAAQDTGIAVLRVFNSSINVLRIDSMRAGKREVRPPSGNVYVKRGDTVAVPFRFVPRRHGEVIDTLVMHTNSWRGDVPVPVAAVVPYPEPETNIGQADFAAIARGDTGSVVISIRNTSISALRVDSLRTRTGWFRVGLPSLPVVIGRDDTVQVAVWFLPDSIRHFSDTLTIVSNGREQYLRVPLMGDGVRPGAAGGGSGMPGEFELFQNFPNPFNSTTTFRYALPEPAHVRLEIFTTLGQRVAVLVDAYQDAGYQNVSWTADVGSGVYYFRLLATPRSEPGRNFSGTKKMVLMR